MILGVDTKNLHCAGESRRAEDYGVACEGTSEVWRQLRFAILQRLSDSASLHLLNAAGELEKA